MVLGREGPTVQLGANIAEMFSDLFRLKDKDNRHTLLASGVTLDYPPLLMPLLPALSLSLKR